jgi:hypothetical protein
MINHGVPQGSILGPLLFLLHRSDLPQLLNNKYKTILFADDTTILFNHTNTTEFNSNIHTVFETIKTWLKNNYFSLNFEKKKHFKLGKIRLLMWRLVIIINYSPNALSTRFLALTVDGALSWRIHINHLTTKLNIAYQVIRPIKPFMFHKTLILIYYSLLHTVRSYRIIFWENSCHRIQIFRMQ